MDAAVTPAIVAKLLYELSTDLVAVVILDAAGEVLAGPATLASAAPGLLELARDAPLAQARTAEHLVVVARTREHTAIAIHTGHALPELVRHDLVTALGDLAASRPGGATADAPPRAMDPASAGVSAAVRAALRSTAPAANGHGIAV